MSKSMYVQSLSVLSALHRFLIDNVNLFLDHDHYHDINATQALIIYHIGSQRVKVNDIIKNHFYEGSNPSYNVKKLTMFSYVSTKPCYHDRRVMYVQLTEKGMTLQRTMDDFFQHQEDVWAFSGLAKERLQQWFQDGQLLAHTWKQFRLRSTLQGPMNARHLSLSEHARRVEG